MLIATAKTSTYDLPSEADSFPVSPNAAGYVQRIRFVVCSLLATLVLSADAQGNCGKAPTAPKWLSNTSNSLNQKSQKAVSAFLRKADRYLQCQDRVNRAALKQLSPQEQRARLDELSRVSQSRNTLQRRLNQSLAKQRSKHPF